MNNMLFKRKTGPPERDLEHHDLAIATPVPRPNCSRASHDGFRLTAADLSFVGLSLPIVLLALAMVMATLQPGLLVVAAMLLPVLVPSIGFVFLLLFLREQDNDPTRGG